MNGGPRAAGGPPAGPPAPGEARARYNRGMAETAPAVTIDDWTRVDAGTFHAFHQTWIGQLALWLNRGRLPGEYYAHPERSFGAVSAGENESDLLTLDPEPDFSAAVFGEWADGGGGTALAEAPPVCEVESALPPPETAAYAARASRLAIKRNLDHRLVALLEVASPGNRDRAEAVDRFADKLAAAIGDGVHAVLIDLHPPTRFAPAGLHAAVVDRLGADAYDPPPGKPLCAAGYRAGRDRRAYVRPLAVGDAPPAVPLFLSPDRYLSVPLADTYHAARDGIGGWWREVLEGRRDPPPAR